MKVFFLGRPALLWSLLLLVAGCMSRPYPGGAGPVEAKDALATFTVADGFQVEMIAAEPLLSDPVDMEIDEFGRLYVVEMHGYPLDKSGSGKIILLSDKDGDGIMDQRTVFREGLMLPTSVMRWKKGVIVTDAPHLLYLEDSDGDGQAETVDTLLQGFALSNPQHNTNSPVYGLDNWIYLAHEGSVSTREYKEEFGDEGSEIIFPGVPNAPKLPQNANGRSVRLRPDQKLLEMTSSRCQFGHTFDAWGHRFGCNNSNQGYHEVIANRYFERNPYLPVSDATHNMSDHLNAAEVFPTTTHPDRQLLTNVGVMTSACGLTSYQGAAFPAPYNQNVTFVAEPVSNLVHVDILRDSGATFTASRILPNKEFFSSTDAWSRPVNLYVGPDGALYVLDYYRRVIESPEWMSEEAIKAGDLYDGMDKGRIYRITPKGSGPADWTRGLSLGSASSAELVQTLTHPNNWWRMHAQRLLVDRGDRSVTTALEQLADQGASPLGRLHALWTLDGMDALTPEVVTRALQDAAPGVRENAIQLAERHLATAPALTGALVALQKDPDPKVRFQLLLTLGYLSTPQAAAARNQILFSDIGDKWVQIAALSAGASQTAPLLEAVLKKYKEAVPAYGSMVQRLTTMVGAGGTAAEVHALVQKAATTTRPTAWQAPMLEGLAQGLRSCKEPLSLAEGDQAQLVEAFFDSPSEALRQGALQLLKVQGPTPVTQGAAQRALALIGDRSQGERKRALAVDFLALSDLAAHVPALQALVVPQEQTPVQLAAIRTLGQVKGTTVSAYLIRQWPVLTPEIREAAIPTFLTDSARIALLIDALEKEKILASQVPFDRSVQLMQNKDAGLRNRARALFTKNERERKKVNQAYQAALELPGDAGKGKVVYQQNCALCHQVRGQMGIAIGPDLGTIHNWIKEDILANVLDPNLSISSGFDLWEVELNGGETLQGLMASETPTAFTLRNNGKMDRTINRQDVKSLRALNTSAMPGGLEKSISQQEMAHLLAFLRQN